VGESDTVWLQDWQRKRRHRRFDLRTGRCLESKVRETDKPSATSYFGVCSRCSAGFVLVYRTLEAVWLQLGSERVRMDNREALFLHERRLGGLVSLLRIEWRDGSRPALTLRSFSVARAVMPLIDFTFDQIDAEEEDFFLWVTNQANDPTWVSWVMERWYPVDTSDASGALTA